jgi:hypothetical protein
VFLNVPGNRFFRTISNSNFKLTRDCSKRTNFTPFSLVFHSCRKVSVPFKKKSSPEKLKKTLLSLGT